MSAAELTINVTEFKAKCLELMSRVNRGELAGINVQKRGRPFARLVPPSEPDPAAFDVEAWRREMQALSGWIPEGYDGTQPMMTDAEAEQFEARVIQKLTGAPRDPNNMWS